MGSPAGRRKVLAAFLNNLARRVLLYGLLASLLWAGGLAHRKLAAAAAAADAPYETMAVRSGELGNSRLHDLLRGGGLDSRQALAVSRALGRRIDPRSLRRRDRYRLAVSTQGDFRHLTLTHGLKRYVVSPAPQGARCAVREVVLTERRRAVSGEVSSSLWLSMESAGVPAAMIAEFAEVFRWTVDFLTEPREGDSFSIVWTERGFPDGRVWDRTIEAGLYEGRATGRRVGLRHDGRYYDEEGDSLERMFLRAPLNFRAITSRFQGRRRHPILRFNRPHHGTDYAAPRGTPVVAVAGGRVDFAGRQGGYGLLVRLRHAGAYATGYAHLQGIARSVRRGSRVRQGQVLGFVGSSGLATGPHLHFEISKDGIKRDFLKLSLPFARSVPRSGRRQFSARRDALVRELRAAPTLVAAGPGR